MSKEFGADQVSEAIARPGFYNTPAIAMVVARNAYRFICKIVNRDTSALRPMVRNQLYRSRPIAMALEPRYLFDGAGVATVVDASHHTNPFVSAPSGPDPLIVALANHVLPADPTAGVSAPTQIKAADPSQTGGKKEVAFIDTSVSDWQALANGAPAGVEVDLIDGRQSGLAQIAKWAETHTGYDVINILSQGSEATLKVGTDTLTDASLSTTTVQVELAEIGHALNAGGEAQLYGSNIGAGGDGQTFVADLAADTGTVVVAADHAVGNAGQGGSWILDVATAPTCVTPLSIPGYLGTLDVGATVTDTSPMPVEVQAANPGLDGGKTEVAFIDTSVVDWQVLANGVRPGVEIELIDGTQSGLAQMAKWAGSHSGYDAIHVLSHGGEATLTLGTDTLTDGSLSAPVVRAELTEIGSALNAGGEILLYGCDVAKGSDGQQFINDLAADTGSAVGASTDATGSASLGGNWTLEAISGTGQTIPSVSSLDLPTFSGLLGDIVTPGTPLVVGSDTVDTPSLQCSELGAAALANGGYVNLWATDGMQNLQNLQVKFTVFDNSNHPVSTGPLYAPDGEVATTGSVAALANGGFVITWTTYNITTGDNSQFYEKFTSDGTASGTYHQINTTGGNGGGVTAHVAELSDGSLAFVYSDNTDGNLYTVVVNSSGVIGTPTEVIPTSLTPNDQGCPAQIAALTGGGYVITANTLVNINQGVDKDVSVYGIFAYHFNNSGVATNFSSLSTSYVRINLSGNTIANITPTSTGGFSVISWDNLPQAGIYGYYFSVYNADGSPVTTTVQTITNEGTNGASATISFRAELFNIGNSSEGSNSPFITEIDGKTVFVGATDGGQFDLVTFDSSTGKLVNGPQTLSMKTSNTATPLAGGLENPYLIKTTSGDWGLFYDDYTNVDSDATQPAGNVYEVGLTPVSANSAPTLTGATGATPTDFGGGSAVSLFSGATAATNDSGQTFAGMTLSVTNVTDTTEYLTINGVDVTLSTATSGLSLGTVSGTDSAGSVTVTGGSSTKTVTITGMALTNSEMSALINGITYKDSSTSPSTTNSRVVTITGITDSGTSNNTASPNTAATITVAAPAAMSWSSSAVTTSYTDAGTNAATYSAATGTLATQNAAASVTYGITGGSTASGSTTDVGSYGTLVVNDSTGAYTYTPNAGEINALQAGTTPTDTFTVTAFDGTTHLTQTFTVNLTGANDPPVVTAGGSGTWTQGGSSVAAHGTTAITVNDVDDTTEKSATITISSGYASGDTLSFSGSYGDISAGSFNTSTHALILTSASGASLANWVSALDAVTFSSSSQNPGVNGTDTSRTVSWVVDDGHASNHASTAVTSTITVSAVDTAPVLSSVSGAASNVWYQGGSSVVLDSAATVADAQLDALNAGAGNYAGASVVIARNGGASTSDVLSLITGGGLTANGGNTTLSSGGNVIATLSETAGTTTITFADNGTIPTTALVNQVMRDIAYSNSNPPTADGTQTVQLTWTFHDGNTGSQGTGGDLTGTGSTTVTLNRTPTVANAESNDTASVGVAFNYQIPANTFHDADGDTLTYTVQQVNSDGSNARALPGWLSFTTNTLSGTPAIGDVGTIYLKVTASDGHSSVSDAVISVVTSATPTIAISTIAGDNIVNASEHSGAVTIGGTTTNVSDGATVTVDIKNGSTSVYTTTTTVSSGSWSISVPSGTVGGIADGSYTVAADVTTATEATRSLTVDTTAPTLAITSNVSALKAGDTATITFTFSEAPTGFTQSDVTLSNGTLSNFAVTGDPKVYTATFTPTASLASGNASITVASGTYTDTAGNTGGAGSTPSISIDTLPPTLTITSDVSAVKAGGTATITFTFSEAPTGFTQSDVTLSNGTLSNFAVTGDPKVYTATFTPTASLASGNASITVGSGTYTDAAGNTGGAGSTPSISIDTLAPTLVITSDVSAVKAGGTATITFTFSEVPTGFTQSDVTLSNGTLSNFAVTGDPKVYTATFTPTASLASGNASITVASGTYTDAAGNTGGAGSTPSISIDTLPPTLTITSDVSAVKAGGTATITFTFSEAPTGFTQSDVTLSNGTLSNFAVTGDPKVYTATFTPTASLASGNASITVASGTYTDAAGNTGGAGSTPSISIDTLPPTLTITSDVSAVKAGGAATITFTFSEAPTGFTQSDVTLSNGTLSNFAVTGDPKVYTATFTPTASLASGNASITVASGAYTDAAGNTGGAGSTPSISIDTLPPTLAITSNVSVLKAGATATITFTFSEAPSGFVAGDVVTSNGTLSNFAVTSDPKVYTATFTPTASLASGNASITVASGTYTDAAGNTGGAGSTPSISIDTLPPSLAITSNVSALKAGDTATITFTFSEAPTGFTQSDVTLSNGTLSNFAVTGDPKVYSATFTPTASLASGNASITVASGTYTDAAGNTGGAGSTPSISIDTLPPTLAITSNVSTLKAGETATITFTFSEAPSGFAAGDVVTSNGTLSNLAVTGDPKVYTATFTPTASLASGNASITVASGTYTDAAGNTGGAGSTPSISIDTLPPTLAITSNVSALKAGATATITFTFSEVPSGFVAGDAVTGNGTLSNFAVTGDPKVYTATFTPTASLASGNASITVASGSYTDAAGNTGGAGSTPSISIDTLPPSKPDAPSLDASSDSGNSNNDQLTNANVLVFNGTAEAGATVELYKNGVATGVTATATGGSYSISYNGAALSDGAYTFTVRATDAAGNTSVASDGISVTIDRTAPSAPPAPTLASASDSGWSNSDGITATTIPTFSGSAEAGSTVKLYDGSTWVATTTADGGGHWSVATSTLGAGSHTITATATDAAGNTSGSSSGQTIIVETAAPNSIAGTLVVPNGSGTGVEIGSVSASDPGGQAVLYELTDSAGGKFAIDQNTGKVTLAGAISYDFSSSGQYPITVSVTDAAGLTSSQTITVKVTLSSPPPPPPPPPSTLTVSTSTSISSNTQPSGNSPQTIGVGTVGSTDTGAGNSGSRLITTGAMNGGSVDTGAGNSGSRLITTSNMNSPSSGSMISNASSVGANDTGGGGVGATFSESLGGSSSFAGSGSGFASASTGFSGAFGAGASGFSGGSTGVGGTAPSTGGPGISSTPGSGSGGLGGTSSTGGTGSTGGDSTAGTGGRLPQGPAEDGNLPQGGQDQTQPGDRGLQDQGQTKGQQGQPQGERGLQGPDQGQQRHPGHNGQGGETPPPQPVPQPHAWLFGPATRSFSEQLADASGKFEHDRLDLLRAVRAVASINDRAAA